MANFYSYDFIFDGVPSHTFDMKIISFDDGGLFNGVGSSDVEILTQRVLRKSKPYYLGRIQQPVLEFELTFGRAQIVSGMDRDLISKWLFGRSGYKKLQILQDDLNGAYFNCFLTKPEPLYIGNLNYAFKCTVVCDSPFGYREAKTWSASPIELYSDEGNTLSTVYIDSSEDDYLYPTISIETGFVGSPPYTITIINQNEIDSNGFYRTFQLTNIELGTWITVDNDLQIISAFQSPLPPDVSVLERQIFSDFNKKWFRFLPGINNIQVYAEGQSFDQIESKLDITYVERVKIGG